MKKREKKKGEKGEKKKKTQRKGERKETTANDEWLVGVMGVVPLHL